MATTEAAEGEFERDTGDGAYEWSVPSASDDDEKRHYRLFVSIEAELSRLIHIEDSPVTSASPGARRMEVDAKKARALSIFLTLDEARWLLVTLPKAIAKVEAAWAEASTKPPPGPPGAEPVHVCLWSSQPDILIACDHSWTTPNWGDSKTYVPDIFLTDDGRRYTFDEPLTTCPACLAVLADPVLREKAGTP